MQPGSTGRMYRQETKWMTPQDTSFAILVSRRLSQNISSQNPEISFIAISKASDRLLMRNSIRRLLIGTTRARREAKKTKWGWELAAVFRRAQAFLKVTNSSRELGVLYIWCFLTEKYNWGERTVCCRYFPTLDPGDGSKCVPVFWRSDRILFRFKSLKW